MSVYLECVCYINAHGLFYASSVQIFFARFLPYSFLGVTVAIVFFYYIKNHRITHLSSLSFLMYIYIHV